MNKPQFTRTIYSICYPETRRVLDTILATPDIHDWYSETWTKKQDTVHGDFFAAWERWVSPALNVDLGQFAYRYPTGGSSEAIREQIAYLLSQGKMIAVFEGEYEGYEAIVKALGQSCKKISRDNWASELPLLNADTDIFFISEPSAIDGNVWCEYPAFMSKTQELGIKVYVDLTYVGAALMPQPVELQYPNIEGIFFSLSKVFGVYYHRVGGVFLKNSNPLLYGNMWFKNILALKYGQALLEALPLNSLAAGLQSAQSAAIEALNAQGYSFTPSSVFLVATAPYKKEEWQKEYLRVPTAKTFRVCLSPLLEAYLYPQK